MNDNQIKSEFTLADVTALQKQMYPLFVGKPFDLVFQALVNSIIDGMQIAYQVPDDKVIDTIITYVKGFTPPEHEGTIQ